MGADPWGYLVDYDEDINAVLQNLRQQEFLAGRYFPAMEDFPLNSSRYENFPPDADPPSPGAQHPSIEAAIEDAAEDGTKSILDMHTVSNNRLCGTVSPLEQMELIHVFGTTKPSLYDFEEDAAVCDRLTDFLDRGQGVYVIFYENDKPNKILFQGYSYD